MRIQHRRLVPAALLAALTLAISLSACAGAPSGETFSGSAASPELARDGLAHMSSLDSAAGGDMFAENSTQMLDRGAQTAVIRTGDTTIVVDDPAATAERVAELASKLGGSVANRSVSLGDDGRAASATLSIRVPDAKFDDAFSQLSDLGRVSNENRNEIDVTLERTDLRARVDALTTSVDRLNELLGSASTTSELIEVENALSQRQQELDGLTAQLDYLEDQVAFSTLWVALVTEAQAPNGPKNFWDGLLAGLASIAAAASGALIAAGVALPWLVVIGVITIIVVAIVRKRRRKREARPTEQLNS